MKYYQPTSLTELFELRSGLISQSSILLAGGTDLVPRFERGMAMPDHLIDLKKLSELNQIQATESRVTIGALTSIQDIQDNEVLATEFLALHKASYDFAGAQIRHRGTIGGNICNASPAGDLLPALYAFEAILTLSGPAGERQLAIKDFILGPGKTTLREAEILKSIILNRDQHLSDFQKVGLRQSMAISVVNVAFVYSKNDDTFKHLKIAAGAVAPTVVLLDSFASAFLKTHENVLGLLQLIEKDISPIDDIRATASYRKKVLANLVKHFLSGQVS